MIVERVEVFVGRIPEKPSHIVLANERRLVAIEFRREKVRVLEQRHQITNKQDLEIQRGKGDVLNQRGRTRELDRQARQRWLDDAARRQTEKLAAFELRRDKLQGKKLERGKVQGQGWQHPLDDDDAVRRVGVQHVKAELEAERGEWSRLNRRAIVQQTQEAWRLQEETIGDAALN